MAVPVWQLDPSASSLTLPVVHLRVVAGGRPSEATYRRRRLVAGLFLVVVVVALALSVRAGAAVLGGDPASAPEPRPLVVDVARAGAVTPAAAPVTFGGQVLEPGGIYVVQPGDTLWAIARALQPRGDLDGLVRRLVRLNGGAELAVGDRITLPA